MLPLLLIFTAFETLCGTACYLSVPPDIGRFAVIAPLSLGVLKDAASLNGTFWRVE
jgi:hypothetical protein